MSVLDTLDQIEGLVAGARTVPFTDRILVNDNDLVHFVEELRRDLPLEVGDAKKIMADKDRIITNAKSEADHIVKQAKDYAGRITEENEIVRNAQDKSREILDTAQKQSRELLDTARANADKLRSDADAYANQVFQQLISHVSSTFDGVQQAEGGLKQALDVLRQAQKQITSSAVPTHTGHKI